MFYSMEFDCCRSFYLLLFFILLDLLFHWKNWTLLCLYIIYVLCIFVLNWALFYENQQQNWFNFTTYADNSNTICWWRIYFFSNKSINNNWHIIRHGIVLYRTVIHRVVIHKARYFCWSLLFLLHAIAAGKYTDHCQWISCSTDTLISTLISTRFTLVCNVIDIKARHTFYTYVHYRMLCLHSCIVLYLVIAWNFIVQFVMDIFY